MGQVELLGMFVQSFARACVNLKILADSEVQAVLASPPDGFISAERFEALLTSIEGRYRNFDPIKERVGVEMMKLWYEFGPGRQQVQTGLGFLELQVSSTGYRSVVRGPDELVGNFAIELLDPAGGRARVRSTTPFDKTMERGILLGGLQGPGDLSFVEVKNADDPGVYQIRFR